MSGMLNVTLSPVPVQRVIPLRCLRPGYRHVRLRTGSGKPQELSTLFIYRFSLSLSLSHSLSLSYIYKYIYIYNSILKVELVTPLISLCHAPAVGEGSSGLDSGMGSSWL